jgi:hypothetical protein
MTTTDFRRPSSPPAHHDATQAWVQELSERLPASCFPGTYDDLASALVRRHAPSHLIWHLSVLPRARRFETPDELLTYLGDATGSAAAVSVPT